MKKIIKDNKVIPYKIIKKNNKNSYFRIKPGYLEISKSKYVSDQVVIDYLSNNFDSFYLKFTDVQKKILPIKKVKLEDKEYDLVIEISKHKSYSIDHDQVLVKFPNNDHIKIKKWLYQEHLTKMVKQLEPLINEVLSKQNIKQRPYRYGYYKSKYGSYHKKHDNITLNVVLATLNRNYLYYVIMHEYAHTKVFNHSKDFYKILEQLMPKYKIYDKQLKAIAIYI